jgi:hypothetical protein
MKPDAARGAQFSETDKDVADRGTHGFVRMEAYLAILLAPDEADGKTTAQLAASGFVADASVETFPQDMQLGLAHRTLEAEQEPVIEHCRVVDAVGIADQSVG